jgi:hypothetical protein
MGEAAAAAAEPIPLATGSRPDWTEVPGRVRAAVEGQLGSPVVSATNQRGGFSPGPATDPDVTALVRFRRWAGVGAAGFR